MRVFSAVLAIGILVYAFFTGCSANNFHFKDVHTGIWLDGRELIVSDRNVGAEFPGGFGTYMNWKKASKICPNGYHLMTVAEARAIIAHEKYNTPQKLVQGDLKIPLSGFGSWQGKKKDANFVHVYKWGDLHLREYFNKDESWYLAFHIGGEFFGADYMSNKDLLNVRCVKGAFKTVSTHYTAESDTESYLHEKSGALDDLHFNR